MFAFGAVVLARFPFADLTGETRRPALVLSRDDGRRPDPVACFITSMPREGPGMAPLEPGVGTGLRRPFPARFDKPATLGRSVIAGQIGAAPRAWLTAQARTVFAVFGFGWP